MTAGGEPIAHQSTRAEALGRRIPTMIWGLVAAVLACTGAGAALLLLMLYRHDGRVNVGLEHAKRRDQVLGDVAKAARKVGELRGSHVIPRPYAAVEKMLP